MARLKPGSTVGGKRILTEDQLPDILGSEVGFSAYITSNQSPDGSNITFDEVSYDYGGDFNASSGVFTAPRTGLYLIHWGGPLRDVDSSLPLSLKLNGESQLLQAVYAMAGHDSARRMADYVTFCWPLQRGDEVSLEARDSTTFVADSIEVQIRENYEVLSFTFSIDLIQPYDQGLSV